jgi:DnaK suppressor protein
VDLTGGEDESEHSHLAQRPADCATELFDGELEQGLEAQLRDALAAVERAERRLVEGTYGRSVESGQPIPGAARGDPSGGAHREGAGAPQARVTRRSKT